MQCENLNNARLKDDGDMNGEPSATKVAPSVHAMAVCRKFVVQTVPCYHTSNGMFMECKEKISGGHADLLCAVLEIHSRVK